MTSLLDDIRYVFRKCLTNVDKPEDELPQRFLEEFEPRSPSFVAASHSEASKRKAKSALSMLFDPRQVATLLTSFGTVFLIGCAEGRLVTNKAHRSLTFTMHYGVSQMLPSIIWATQPASLIARRCGQDPGKILRNFRDCGEDAVTQLKILRLQSLRSVIAGFLGIAQIFTIVNVFSDANQQYSQSLSLGKEPFFNGTKERVIRLAGSTSDITNVSLDRFQSHIVPICEDPHTVEVESMIEEHSLDGTVPIFWHVPDKAYGRAGSWGAKRKGKSGKKKVSKDTDISNFDLENAKFQVTRDWTIPIKDGEKECRALIIEADSSVGEQALALGAESSNDMTVSEASLAFRSLEKLARTQGALEADDKVVRVLLADSNAIQTTGGGREYSLRKHVEVHGSADILIDAKVPLLRAIIEWAEKAITERHGKKHSKKRQIFFDTSNVEYFATVKTILGKFGWEVLDGGYTESKHYKDIPVLCYNNSTAETVNTVRTLLKSHKTPPKMVCALLDNYEGQRDLNQLFKELGIKETEKVSSICSAIIYDYVFQSVRLLIRAGFSIEQIQTFLDKELHNIEKA
eukprot:g3884.t1